MAIISATLYRSGGIGNVAWAQVLVDSVTNATLYKLYRSETEGVPGTLVGSSTGTLFTDDTINLGTTYFYTVTSTVGGVEGEPSAEAQLVAQSSTPVAAGLVIASANPNASWERIAWEAGATKALASPPYGLCYANGKFYIGGGALRSLNTDLSGDETELWEFTPGYNQTNSMSAAVANDGSTILMALLNESNWGLYNQSIARVSLPPTGQLFNADGVAIPPTNPRSNCVMQNVDGRYWVTDNACMRIAMYSESMKFLGNASKGTTNEVVHATAIAHDSTGRVFVAVNGGGNVQIYDADGNLIGAFGERHDSVGGFVMIGSIYVDYLDRVWIADWGNGHITRWSRDGQVTGVLTNDPVENMQSPFGGPFISGLTFLSPTVGAVVQHWAPDYDIKLFTLV